jgi:hypothetical protein
LKPCTTNTSRALKASIFFQRFAQFNELYNRLETFAERLAREDGGADNEIDGDDAIKLYNELVKSPEDRLALEKEIPSLVAARDQAVTAAKRELLQKETARKRDHIAKMRR